MLIAAQSQVGITILKWKDKRVVFALSTQHNDSQILQRAKNDWRLQLDQDFCWYVEPDVRVYAFFEKDYEVVHSFIFPPNHTNIYGQRMTSVLWRHLEDKVQRI